MDASTQQTYLYLKEKYNRTVIGKKEMASELHISPSTLDLYMARGMGLPKYKKLGSSKNARVIFNIYDLAVYLNTEYIETI